MKLEMNVQLIHGKPTRAKALAAANNCSKAIEAIGDTLKLIIKNRGYYHEKYGREVVANLVRDLNKTADSFYASGWKMFEVADQLRDEG